MTAWIPQLPRRRRRSPVHMTRLDAAQKAPRPHRQFACQCGRNAGTPCLLGRRCQRHFLDLSKLSARYHFETAAMKGVQRRAVADRDEGRALEPFQQQPVKGCFGALVERGGCLIEEQIIRRLQQRARDREPLLFALRQHAIPMRLLVEARDELRQADRGERLRNTGIIERAAGCGIGDGVRKRRERKIGALRHQHHFRAVGHADLTGPKRPDAGNRPAAMSICPRLRGR